MWGFFLAYAIFFAKFYSSLIPQHYYKIFFLST